MANKKATIRPVFEVCKVLPKQYPNTMFITPIAANKLIIWVSLGNNFQAIVRKLKYKELFLRVS
jgi:hypothetical protein